jgi:hypothetical protein
VSLTAGAVGYPLGRFAAWSALAGTGWALYTPLVGYLGGHLTGRNPLHGMLVGIGLALLVTLLLEVGRRRGWRLPFRRHAGGAESARPRGTATTTARRPTGRPLSTPVAVWSRPATPGPATPVTRSPAAAAGVVRNVAGRA